MINFRNKILTTVNFTIKLDNKITVVRVLERVKTFC